MLVPFNDIVCFTAAFALAIYWRKKPEYHRRLVLIASCALTAAGWGRFPGSFFQNFFYAGVDSLIFLGVVRDWIVNRRVHVVYKYALPAIMVAQTFVIYTVTTNQSYWLKISNAILR
jgi:hypothetical protein